MKWREGAALLCAAFGCGEPPRASVQIDVPDECFGRADTILCNAGVALTCESGSIAERADCALDGLSCVDGRGCRTCAPFQFSCDEQTRVRCNRDGTGFEPLETCAPPTSCSAYGCRDLCADALAERSYLGCDYWPVFPSNRELDPLFSPALAIGNGNLVPARVAIRKGAELVAELEVPAHSATTLELAFDQALKASDGSSVVEAGAYHLQASVPVTVHQFNPLLFEVPSDCLNPLNDPIDQNDSQCNSYTNDASLLFPSSALAPEAEEARITFIAASRTSFMVMRDGRFHAGPGFVAVVAVGTQPAAVEVTSSAYTLSSAPGVWPELEALAPGQLLKRTLAPGDVLQLLSASPTTCPSGPVSESAFCDPGPDYDLTGTVIGADGPIQVISGHDCSNVPFDRVACDHLEESLVPLRAWGTSAVVTRPRVGADAYVLRVISGADDNAISFEPPIREPARLMRGAWLELSAEAPVVVRGSQRLLVAQYLVGQGNFGKLGDPSLSLAVPVDQYRRAYNFVTPATYRSNFADVVALASDTVRLDGTLITAFEPIGQSGLSVASVALARSGAHELAGTTAMGLGLQLYGLGDFTSYMLPGGLDLQPLAGPVF